MFTEVSNRQSTRKSAAHASLASAPGTLRGANCSAGPTPAHTLRSRSDPLNFLHTPYTLPGTSSNHYADLYDGSESSQVPNTDIGPDHWDVNHVTFSDHATFGNHSGISLRSSTSDGTTPRSGSGFVGTKDDSTGAPQWTQDSSLPEWTRDYTLPDPEHVLGPSGDVPDTQPSRILALVINAPQYHRYTPVEYATSSYEALMHSQGMHPYIYEFIGHELHLVM